MQLFMTKLRLNLKHINVSSFQKADIAKLEKVVLNEARTAVNGTIVGHSAIEIAEKAGLKVPAGTKLAFGRNSRCNNGTPTCLGKLFPVLALSNLMKEDGFKKQKVCLIWVVSDTQLLSTLKMKSSNSNMVFA